MEHYCDESLNYLSQDPLIQRNQRKTFWVVSLTASMMVVEIISGYLTSSMALLADGWHMASHAGALTISLLAYRLSQSPRMNRRFTFGAGKLIPLGGYTSAIILALIAILMAIESVKRLYAPVPIQFNQAIVVAVVGLIVNILSAFILNDEHHHHGRGDHRDHEAHDERDHHSHDHKHVHDHNLRSAYFHVIADALTSILAIVALVFGKFYDAIWMDATMGIVGSTVILRWAYILCKEAGWELLDGHSKAFNFRGLKALLERDETKILDLHVWRIAPKATACEIVVATASPRGTEHYRSLIREKFSIQHIIVEERAL